MRNNPKTRNNSTELIPLIKPVDTPSAYPLPATTPQKQGRERNPIRYLSATGLIPLIKPVDRMGDYNAPFTPLDRFGDYNTPFSPLKIGNVSSPNSFPTNLRNIKPFCSGRHSHPSMIDKNPSQSKKENNEPQRIRINRTNGYVNYH